MPLLAKLFVWLTGNIYGLILSAFGAKWAIRVSAITALAGLYVASAVAFSTLIVPWLDAFASTQFGILLGLLFPPVAGTVLASLAAFWAVILASRYSAKLIKMTIT